jgi:AcrR family transcriptional regulator
MVARFWLVIGPSQVLAIPEAYPETFDFGVPAPPRCSERTGSLEDSAFLPDCAESSAVTHRKPFEVDHLPGGTTWLGLEHPCTVANMSVQIRAGEALLDTAVAVLTADPGASLSEVAAAAGIGRTTLHKHYPTRDDLVRAVGFRAIERAEQATAAVTGAAGALAGLRELAEAMVPLGPHLAFLWRTPAFDHDQAIGDRWRAVEEHLYAILDRARADGLLRDRLPDYWLLQAFHSLVYVASELVHTGHLAPRDAPGLVLDTFLHGVGHPPVGESPVGGSPVRASAVRASPIGTSPVREP